MPGVLTSRRVLLESAGEHCTILTATSRLARVLQKEYAAWKQGSGALAWETPDILPLNAWLARCISSPVLNAEVQRLTPDGTLDSIHEEVLWEDAVRAEVVEAGGVSVEALARLMMRAHDMEREWLLSGGIDGTLSDDAAMYVRVRDSVLGRCAVSRFRPAALQWEVCEHMITAGAVSLRTTIVLAGFERSLPSALRRLLDAVESRGVSILRFEAESLQEDSRRMVFATKDQEICAAAAWARRLLEAGEEDIGIVFPRLQDYRGRVERMFSDVLLPEQSTRSSHDSGAVFELSLGVRLSQEALVNAALHALDLLSAEVRTDTVSRVLRSPFFTAGGQYASSRSSVDAELRKQALDEESWPSFRSRLELCTHGDAGDPLLRSVAALNVPSERGLPSMWADYFDAFLSDLGWPGDGVLSSREFQARLRFQEQLSAMAGFDALLGKITVSEATARLRRLTSAAVFQPQSRNAPVQIMGVFEALGQQFRHLRVCDMTEESWPPPARPAAFIPVSLQKRAGVADAVAEMHAADMERVTRALLASSPDLIVSSAAAADDRELLPSPLTLAYPLVEADDAGVLTAEWLRSTTDIAPEAFRDTLAPPLPADGDAPGGSAVFTLQARCPFRAFAQLRLRAKALGLPEHGVRPLDRGILLHECLRRLWQNLGGYETLQSGEHGELIARIVREVFRSALAIRSGRLAEVMVLAEMECVTRILKEILEIDRLREPFDILQVETPATITLAGLTLSLRIDRIDRLADGSFAVIDYKTSAKSIEDWMSDRPLEPQLPLYALTMRDRVSALAFAVVKRSDCRYIGIADGVEHFSMLNDVESLTDEQGQPLRWPTIVNDWAQTLGALAESFRSGDARVDPRDGAPTCEYCDMQPLCRIDEYRKQNASTIEVRDE